MRLLVAEDDPQIQACLILLLEPEHEIVGTVENGLDVVLKVIRFQPDILLLDVSLPGISGFQVARRLRGSGNFTRIIFVTNHTDPAYVAEARRLGAEGYVYKARAQTELPVAIQQVSQGASYVSPDLPAAHGMDIRSAGLD